jgi:hypothetical protein
MKNEMGQGMGDNKGFWWGDLGERDQLEGLGTDRGTLLKLIFTKRYKEGGMDSNDLA